MSAGADVSVVVPCYQCSQTIARAVTSVAMQTSRPVELILVDDCSTDGTRALLLELASRYEPGWIRLVLFEKNGGVANARNAGWALATQPYLAFLDSDDAWHPEKIAVQHAYMMANPHVALSGHACRSMAQDGLPDWAVAARDAQQVGKWAMLLSNRFVTPSVMLRRDMPQRFLRDQRYMEDHMLWLSIVCSGASVVKLPVELAAIYKAPFGVSGLSSRLWLMERGDLENYRRLYRQSFLNTMQFAMLCVYSLLKYVRRLAMHGVRRRLTR